MLLEIVALVIEIAIPIIIGTLAPLNLLAFASILAIAWVVIAFLWLFLDGDWRWRGLVLGIILAVWILTGF